MKTYNPNKRLAIEIHSNEGSGCNGYTVWRSINGVLKHTMSRNADNSDFDWMSDKENKQFESGRYKFSISAEQASEYFDYVY